jgi:multidrug efflux pump subunit AcrB
MARTSDVLRDRLNISRLAIEHSWLTICCWIVIAVAGLFAYSSLKYGLFPDITFPVVVVNATAPVPTALESESQLTQPLEAQFLPLAGITKVSSTTSPGRSVTNLRFGVGTSLEESTAAVEQAISRANLPPQAEVEVVPLNLNEATAVSYAIASETLSLSNLADLAETDVLAPLREIPGVLRVDLLGAGNSAGTAQNAQGSFLANLQNPPTLIRFNNQAALAFEVIKRSDANTLEVVDRVEAEIARIRSALPNVQLTLAATQADFIKEATQATIDSLWGAIVLAVLVIFGFLRSWWATLITALAIPLSLLGTYIVMAIFGFNLETITLLALALVIGIIVDDAIVEVENIMRHLELGVSPRQAAIIATQEIGLTVSVSTLTIVAVFLPVAFMGGTVGQFFKPFGLTVSAAVLTSLLVARTLTPVLAVYWLRPKRRQALAETPLSDNLQNIDPVDPASISSWERGYSRLLAWALRHKGAVVGIAIASFIAGIAIIPLIPQGFIPQLDRGEFYLNYTAPIPQSAPGALALGPPAAGERPVDPRARLLQLSLATAEPIEEIVSELPEVASVLTTVGGQGRPNEGRLHIQLKADRARDTAAVQTQLRQDLLNSDNPRLNGVVTSVEDIQFVDTGGEKPVQVVLLGEDLTALNQAITEVKAEVEKLPGFADIRVSGEANTADAVVEINRQGGQRAASISANLGPGKALGDATEQVVEIAQSIIPPEISIDLGGDSARVGEVLGSFGRTLALAVVCMLAVVLVPFGRLLEPAVVGLSLPLSIVGAMLALLVTRSDFGMVSLLGLLFLLGLLAKSALLLMDYANLLQQWGMKRSEAIVKTGIVRLRPILMTTASTVLGMLPIAFGLGAGSELRQPLAVAIIGGLVTSTLLSLVVVPVLYCLLEDGWQRLTGRSSGRSS